ncbi:MAG TPA: TIGR03435 family protein [Bryobacteraceae bacterium]
MLPFVVAATVAFGQQPPAFEVASIKPDAQGEGADFDFGFTPDGGIRSRNFSVWNLIRSAYKLRNLQIAGGPSWIKSQGFDIQAKPPQTGTPVTREQTLLMLQTLLEDRFNLKFHREIRQVPSYALAVARQGPKLPPPRNGRSRPAMGDLDVASMTMESLCQALEFDLDRPVVNQTGLDGPFAIRLQWASDRGPNGATDPAKPSLFTAIEEQLGLKLDATRAPLEMFVIDSVERPSEN